MINENHSKKDVLAKIYKNYSIEEKDRREFRELLEEYLQFLDDNEPTNEPLSKQLYEQESRLQSEFDEGKKGVTVLAGAREAEHLNIIFNRINRLKTLRTKLPQIEELLLKLAGDKKYREAVAANIESVDYEKPSFWSRVLDAFLFSQGGRPK